MSSYAFEVFCIAVSGMYKSLNKIGLCYLMNKTGYCLKLTKCYLVPPSDAYSKVGIVADLASHSLKLLQATAGERHHGQISAGKPMIASIASPHPWRLERLVIKCARMLLSEYRY